MIKVSAQTIANVVAAQNPVDLHEHIHQAIRLEFSTIPPYLTAMLSLHPGANREIWNTIHSIVVDEMLHMTIACNLQNAIGGEIYLDDPDFLPKYPGKLPLSIGDSLFVPLEKFSLDLMGDVFMEIEKPEKPIMISDAESPEYATIGDFYDALSQTIARLGDSIFTGDRRRQVVPVDWFGNRVYPLENVEDTLRAINLIKAEGEGSPLSPLDPDGEFAHYYRFQELHALKRIVSDP